MSLPRNLIIVVVNIKLEKTVNRPAIPENKKENEVNEIFIGSKLKYGKCNGLIICKNGFLCAKQQN